MKKFNIAGVCSRKALYGRFNQQIRYNRKKMLVAFS